MTSPDGTTHRGVAVTALDTAEQAAIDERWTSTVVLGNGDTAIIRPIRPADADALQAFHKAQSPDSRYRRYFSPKPELTEAELRRFTHVDFKRRAALVVELDAAMVAWASYEQLQHRDDAEVAFMVDDGHHGQGIATLLLEHLAAIATANRIRRFTAQALAENRGMIAVFTKAGWPVQRRFESGVIDVEFPLEDTTDYIDSVERREQHAESRSIARMLLPISVALIGASEVPGSVGSALWRHISSDTTRAVYPVNPAHETIGGVAAYKSITDINQAIGLAVVAVPPSELRATLDECIAARVRSAVVITNLEGDDIDVDELIAHTRRNGLRIIGPASMGVASPLPSVQLQASIVDVNLPPGRVAIGMQSGSLGAALLRRAADLELGLSWFVSLGDKQDVSANDLLQFWSDDEATSVIALYLESVGNPRKFARIARRVSRQQPIIALRAGAAAGIPNNDAIYRDIGVIEVPSVPAMLDSARILATQPLATTDVVAIVTNSRSPAALATARLQALGARVEATPRHLPWSATAADFTDAIAAALGDDKVGAVLVINAPPVPDEIEAPIEAIDKTATEANKPIVVVRLGTTDGPLRPGSSVPAFAFPEEASSALARAVRYASWRRDDAAVVTDEQATVLNAASVAEAINHNVDSGTLDPTELRVVLAAYGIAMPPTVAVTELEQVVPTAEKIGYPVALKAINRRTGRSAEAGIALDLTDVADVEASAEKIVDSLGTDAWPMIVQRMLAPGVDLRLRAFVDPDIGPLVTVGLGGVHADLIADETTRLAPVSSGSARDMVRATRAAPALDDTQIDVVAAALTRLSQLVSDHADIAELDLNPVIVHGNQAWVADASIRLERPAAPKAVRRLDD